MRALRTDSLSKGLWGFTAALLHKWWLTVLAVLSFGSTIATYVPAFYSRFPGFPRWVPFAVFVLTFFIACFRVFRDQQREISRLQHVIDQLERKKAELVIHDRRSMFFRAWDENTRTVCGTYVRFELVVENRGNRHSTIDGFDLEVAEMQKTYSNLKQLRKTGVQTPTAHVGISGPDLAPGDIVRVDAEKSVGPGQLLFYLPEVPPPDTHVLHCKLILRDTLNISASRVFKTPEYGHGTW